MKKKILYTLFKWTCKRLLVLEGWSPVPNSVEGFPRWQNSSGTEILLEQSALSRIIQNTEKTLRS